MNDAELIQHIAESGVEFDDDRLSWITVQIDRNLWSLIQWRAAEELVIEKKAGRR